MIGVLELGPKEMPDGRISNVRLKLEKSFTSVKLGHVNHSSTRNFEYKTLPLTKY
jgi:hypothetical protein